MWATTAVSLSSRDSLEGTRTSDAAHQRQKVLARERRDVVEDLHDDAAIRLRLRAALALRRPLVVVRVMLGHRLNLPPAKLADLLARQGVFQVIAFHKVTRPSELRLRVIDVDVKVRERPTTRCQRCHSSKVHHKS